MSLRLFVVIAIVALGCKPKCDSSIAIFEGSHFEKGQRYVLSVDDGDLERSQSFWVEMSRGKFDKIADYCGKKDSIRVRFTLDSKDTVFYVFPDRTRRLLIGSYSDGSILVATDQNPDAWIQM